jgi:hypothetical protein
MRCLLCIADCRGEVRWSVRDARLYVDRQLNPLSSPEARGSFGCWGGGMDLASAPRRLLGLSRLDAPFFGVSG